MDKYNISLKSKKRNFTYQNANKICLLLLVEYSIWMQDFSIFLRSNERKASDLMIHEDYKDLNDL